MKLKTKETLKKQIGITLIALVITIVVLLILAGVSINVLFSDNGIIKSAQNAKNKINEAEQNDLAQINELNNWLENQAGISNSTGGGTGGSTGGDTPNPSVHPSETIKSKETGKSIGKGIQPSTVIAKDGKENQVVIPGGFKIADDSGDTVQEGIVIEDANGNQFVWVPVSNINGDGSNKIIKNDGSKVEITLGRYTFAKDSVGTPTIIQKGSEYAETTVEKATAGTLDTKYRAGDYYYELSDYRVSNEKSDTTGTNTTAKDLQAFIEKANTNKGFYIARYEASYGSGYNSSGSTSAEQYGNAKPLSKVSTANSTSSMNYTVGTLWNFITQGQAAIVSQNMYKNDSYVESDLVNSYAWDTAIVYIQAMGNTNYANANRGTSTTLMNTGLTGDQKCKIFDMAANLLEWTTEYSTLAISKVAFPCTDRGGVYYDSDNYTSYRHDYIATYRSNNVSFRTLLYVK